MIVEPTDIFLDVVLNHTMSRRFSVSRHRADVPIVGVKAVIQASQATESTTSSSSAASSSTAQTLRHKRPMHLTINPTNIRPLSVLLDEIAQYNVRALVRRSRACMYLVLNLTRCSKSAFLMFWFDNSLDRLGDLNLERLQQKFHKAFSHTYPTPPPPPPLLLPLPLPLPPKLTNAKQCTCVLFQDTTSSLHPSAGI